MNKIYGVRTFAEQTVANLWRNACKIRLFYSQFYKVNMLSLGRDRQQPQGNRPKSYII
jgi:hypothetical protein